MKLCLEDNFFAAENIPSPGSTKQFSWLYNGLTKQKENFRSEDRSGKYGKRLCSDIEMQGRFDVEDARMEDIGMEDTKMERIPEWLWSCSGGYAKIAIEEMEDAASG